MFFKKEKVSLVHSHGYKSDIIGLFASKLAGCRIISTPHGWSREADRKLILYERLDRFFLRFVDAVCPLSSDLLSSIHSSVSKNKINLILNGVDIVETKKLSIFSSEFVADPDLLTIGYVGQLIDRKNVKLLILALKELLLRKNNVRVLIVGDGPNRDSLKALCVELGVAEHVHFLGFRHDALSIMRIFDVFVLPSLLEGIPRCVMEAMILKVPVVISAIEGNKALVVDKENGLLFAPNDAHALSDALYSISSDEEMRKVFIEKSYEKVLNTHSNVKMAQEYVKVYSGLL